MDGITRKNGFVFFWGSHLSNWAITPFTVEGVEYNTGEQWMMAEKAKLFNDSTTLGMIMAAHDPREQKKLGRTVVGFKKDAWDAVCKDRVYVGLLAKYQQHPLLSEKLLATGDNVIVEASPYDTIWGIGLPEDHPDCTNPSKWRGKNYLGEVLMRVRATLRQEAAAKAEQPT